MRTWMGILVGLTLLLTPFTHPAQAESPTSRDDLPKKAYIQGLNGHPQRYILSCEARSAVDLAAFWGVKISETDFLNRLPKSADPEAGFVGNANDPWGLVPPSSYGVHAGPVSDLLNAYGLQTKASKDLTWDNLRAEIAAGRPAIVWIIGQMWDGTPLKYRAAKGSSPTIVANFEHTMILVGYTPQRVQVVDAYTGFEQTYPLEQFKASWAVLGNMAVTGLVVNPLDGNLNPENTYQVQPGDNLVSVAQQKGISLDQLAELNQILDPYSLAVGSILRLPPVVTVPGPYQDLDSSRMKDSAHTVFLPAFFQVGTPGQEVSAGPASLPPDGQLTYVVQDGEFLIQIAQYFGVDWRDLAVLNSIDSPYQLVPGQVLRIH